MWSGLRRLESGSLIENTQCWEESSCLRSQRSRGWSELDKFYCFYHCYCFMDIRNICSFHEPSIPHLLFPRKITGKGQLSWLSFWLKSNANLNTDKHVCSSKWEWCKWELCYFHLALKCDELNGLLLSWFFPPKHFDMYALYRRGGLSPAVSLLLTIFFPIFLPYLSWL